MLEPLEVELLVLESGILKDEGSSSVFVFDSDVRLESELGMTEGSCDKVSSLEFDDGVVLNVVLTDGVVESFESRGASSLLELDSPLETRGTLNLSLELNDDIDESNRLVESVESSVESEGISLDAADSVSIGWIVEGSEDSKVELIFKL